MPRGEVLVSILNKEDDLEILKRDLWYRIPVSSAKKWLSKHWPPVWIAFYQTSVFGKEKYSIRYYGKVKEIKKAHRYELFPNEERNAKTNRLYHKIILYSLEELRRPIRSNRGRRLIFIPTTLAKFRKATEINDLFNESKLEDQLWIAFKKFNIAAERQVFTLAGGKFRALDFALYCEEGKIDVETDGDYWHANPERAASDNLRDNSLKTDGWRVLRFNGDQINNSLQDYCLPTINSNIKKLGGVHESRIRFDDDAGQKKETGEK
ncbi:MAG: endonuclease domain-containing protein [Candidatus Kryptoniota bacterium]